MTRHEFREELRRSKEYEQTLEERRAWWDRERITPIFSLGTSLVVFGWLAAILYLAGVILLVGSVVLIWPYTIQQVVQLYQEEFSLAAPALTVLLVLLAAMFVHDVKETRATAEAPWRRYMLLSILFTAAIRQCVVLTWGMASVDTLIGYAVDGFFLSLMPALILYYVEFRTQGYRGFGSMMAFHICCRVKGGGTVFVVMGVLVLIPTLLLLIARLIEQPGATWGMVLAPLGVSLLSLYIGKAGDC